MNFNDSQKNVINLVNGDLLVSASAGSGKTTVLVQRIINLILNHNVSINEILVITFTNAAALEMKERVIKVLEDIIDEDNKDILEEQMILISNSNIQTFHSFCLEVLKNNYYKLNLSGNFKILREGARKILINEVLEDTFIYYYEKEDEDFLNLVNIYGGKYSDVNLREFVILIYSFIQNIVNVDDFINESIDIYDLKENEDILSTVFGEVFRVKSLERFNLFKEKLFEFSYGLHKDDKIYKVILDDIGILNNLIDKFNISYEETYNYIHEIKFSRLPKLSEDFKDYKTLRDELKDFLDNLKKSIFIVDDKTIRLHMSDLKHIVRKLFEVVCEFRDRFRDKKLSQNLIDFNDMEHLTIKLLEDSTISNYYRDKFKYIFIDEYQDTNYIQEHIIHQIKRQNPNNVFMVGDVKQSIYGFRGAKVDLFYEKYKEFNKVDSLDKTHPNRNKILLYDNYRSRDEIIDFINFVFKNIMTKDVSNIEYTHEEYLKSSSDYESLISDNEEYSGEVTLSIVVSEDKDNEFEDSEDIDENECTLIVDYINKLINEVSPIYKVYDKSVESYRKIEYRDIVILMRNVNTSSKAILLQDKLSEFNIPVYFDGGEKFFDSIEVITILSLLKIINNPLDDIDVLTVLRSEMFNFSHNDLTYIRIVNDEEYLYNNIKTILTLSDEDLPEIFLNENFSIESNKFQLLYDKCRMFIEKIEMYRKKSLFMKIDEFIWFVYEDSGYYFLVSTMDDGLKKQNNLRLIFNKAKEFRLSSFSGLFNFIEHLKNSKKFGDDTLVPKNVSENENVVRIMSIHKSKGLEFPVVILCNTSGRFNFKDLNNQVVLHDKFGVGINHIDYEFNLESESLLKYVIKDSSRRNIISEELRILYVALTRAKEKLFITGSYNSYKSFNNAYNLEKCRSYLDFLCNALMKHKEGDVFKEYVDNYKSLGLDECNVKINLYINEDFNDSSKEDVIDENINVEDILSDNNRDISYIEEILNFDYKYKDLLDLPVNLSVSEILSYGEEEKLNINFKTPMFLDEDNKKIYTPMDIGNLYHLFMQNLVLSENITYEYLTYEINRMVEFEIMSLEDIEYIDLNKVLRFFNHNIGSRMIKSFKDNVKNVYREFEFLMNHKIEKISKDHNIRIQGIIDLFFYEDENIILIDYKTDKRILDKNKAVPNKYKEQLSYYKIALEKIFNKKVIESYIYSFEYGDFFKV